MLPVLTLFPLPPAPFRDGLESELYFSSCNHYPRVAYMNLLMKAWGYTPRLWTQMRTKPTIRTRRTSPAHCIGLYHIVLIRSPFNCCLWWVFHCVPVINHTYKFYSNKLHVASGYKMQANVSSMQKYSMYTNERFYYITQTHFPCELSKWLVCIHKV